MPPTSDFNQFVAFQVKNSLKTDKMLIFPLFYTTGSTRQEVHDSIYWYPVWHFMHSCVVYTTPCVTCTRRLASRVHNGGTRRGPSQGPSMGYTMEALDGVHNGALAGVHNGGPRWGTQQAPSMGYTTGAIDEVHNGALAGVHNGGPRWGTQQGPLMGYTMGALDGVHNGGPRWGTQQGPRQGTPQVVQYPKFWGRGLGGPLLKNLNFG